MIILSLLYQTGFFWNFVTSKLFATFLLFLFSWHCVLKRIRERRERGLILQISGSQPLVRVSLVYWRPQTFFQWRAKWYYLSKKDTIFPKKVWKHTIFGRPGGKSWVATSFLFTHAENVCILRTTNTYIQEV